eukprot:scaffold2512_cov120-Cylindrotheca_fusiformis.AAC.1
MNKVLPDTQGQQQSLRDETRDRCSAVRNHRISFGDAVDPNAERVDTIDNRDILFGRGKGFQDRDGNKRMREIVENYKEQYHLLNRRHKRNLVEKVHREILEGGARFLTRLSMTTGDCFVLVDGEVALQKVNNALRSKKNISKLSASNSIPTRSEIAGKTDISSGRACDARGSLDLLLNQLSSEMIRPVDTFQFFGFNGYMVPTVTMPVVPGSQATLPIFNVYSGLQRDLIRRETMILQQQFEYPSSIEAVAVYSRKNMNKDARIDAGGRIVMDHSGTSHQNGIFKFSVKRRMAQGSQQEVIPVAIVPPTIITISVTRTSLVVTHCMNPVRRSITRN